MNDKYECVVSCSSVDSEEDVYERDSSNELSQVVYYEKHRNFGDTSSE
jgi:hypothetical protein